MHARLGLEPVVTPVQHSLKRFLRRVVAVHPPNRMSKKLEAAVCPNGSMIIWMAVVPPSTGIRAIPHLFGKTWRVGVQPTFYRKVPAQQIRLRPVQTENVDGPLGQQLNDVNLFRQPLA